MLFGHGRGGFDRCPRPLVRERQCLQGCQGPLQLQSSRDLSFDVVCRRHVGRQIGRRSTRARAHRVRGDVAGHGDAPRKEIVRAVVVGAVHEYSEGDLLHDVVDVDGGHPACEQVPPKAGLHCAPDIVEGARCKRCRGPACTGHEPISPVSCWRRVRVRCGPLRRLDRASVGGRDPAHRPSRLCGHRSRSSHGRLPPLDRGVSPVRPPRRVSLLRRRASSCGCAVTPVAECATTGP